MTDLRKELRLAWEDLTWSGPPEGIIKTTTSEIEPQKEIIGQERAVKALRRGLAMKGSGFNIFAAGTIGTGRIVTVLKLLDEFNVGGPIPNDLCYVNNFKNPDQPRLLSFETSWDR
jgi:Cdc6-like AAA superfamily ATPase